MLRAAFESLVGGEEIWDVKPAQVYTTLARLEGGRLVHREGIDQGGGPEKHIFAIAPAGRPRGMARLGSRGIARAGRVLREADAEPFGESRRRSSRRSAGRCTRTCTTSPPGEGGAIR